MLVALVVEDNVALRSAVARYLERRGWQNVSAANGLQGLDAVRRRSFDVVISDVKMPASDGELPWENALAIRLELGGRYVCKASNTAPGPRALALHVTSE